MPFAIEASLPSPSMGLRLPMRDGNEMNDEAALHGELRRDRGAVRRAARPGTGRAGAAATASAPGAGRCEARASRRDPLRSARSVVAAPDVHHAVRRSACGPTATPACAGRASSFGRPRRSGARSVAGTSGDRRGAQRVPVAGYGGGRSARRSTRPRRRRRRSWRRRRSRDDRTPAVSLAATAVRLRTRQCRYLPHPGEVVGRNGSFRACRRHAVLRMLRPDDDLLPAFLAAHPACRGVLPSSMPIGWFRHFR